MERQEPKNPHRQTERSAYPYVDEPPEALEKIGFEFVGNIERGTSLDADVPIIDLEIKKIEDALTEKGIARPPRFGDYTDLKHYIIDAMKAGYEVQCLEGEYNNGSMISGKHMTAIFQRFDIDRFITRKAHGVRERLLEKGGYKRLDEPMPFHYWGDAMKNVQTEHERKVYEKENEKIIERITALEHNGVHVRLIEGAPKKKDGPFRMIFYAQQFDSGVEYPYEIHRTLSGFTEESPTLLMTRGFSAEEVVQRDKSLDPDAQKVRNPVGLDGQYLLIAKELWDNGLPRIQTPPPAAMTVRDRIMSGLRNGYEVRVVPGRFDAFTSQWHQESRGVASLFKRFDLMRFMAPPDKKAFGELKREGFTLHIELNDQGAASVLYFPLIAWGDTIDTLTVKEIGQVHTQSRALEAYIRDQNSDGFQVRLFPGRVSLDSVPDLGSPYTGCTALRRRKTWN